MLIVDFHRDYDCLCGQVIGKLDTGLKFLKVGSASVFFWQRGNNCMFEPLWHFTLYGL